MENPQIVKSAFTQAAEAATEVGTNGGLKVRDVATAAGSVVAKVAGSSMGFVRGFVRGVRGNGVTGR